MDDKYAWVTQDTAAVCAMLVQTQRRARAEAEQSKTAAEEAPAGPSYLTNTLAGAGVGGLLGVGRSLWRGQRRGTRILQDALTGALLGGTTGAGATAAYDLLTQPTLVPDRYQPTQEQIDIERRRDAHLRSRKSLGFPVPPNDPILEEYANAVRAGKVDREKMRAAETASNKNTPAEPGTVAGNVGQKIGDGLGVGTSLLEGQPGQAGTHATNLLRHTGVTQVADTSPTGLLTTAGALAGSAVGASRVGEYQRNKALRGLLSRNGSSAEFLKEAPKVGTKKVPLTPQAEARNREINRRNLAIEHLRNPNNAPKFTWDALYNPRERGLTTANGGYLTRKEIETILAKEKVSPGWKARTGSGLGFFLAPLAIKEFLQNRGDPAARARRESGTMDDIRVP